MIIIIIIIIIIDKISITIIAVIRNIICCSLFTYKSDQKYFTNKVLKYVFYGYDNAFSIHVVSAQVVQI